MARVTVEDCVTKVPNRFELVMMAAQRSRNISAGSPLTLERDNDKNPVVALREIAEETIELKELNNTLVRSLQKHVEMDEPEEDEMDLDAIQLALGGEGDGDGDEASAQADGAGEGAGNEGDAGAQEKGIEIEAKKPVEDSSLESAEKEEA